MTIRGTKLTTVHRIIESLGIADSVLTGEIFADIFPVYYTRDLGTSLCVHLVLSGFFRRLRDKIFLLHKTYFGITHLK